MIVGATFLTMLNTLGNANTFWVYAALNVLFILLTLWLVPETKHVSLEHIERNLMKGRKLRYFLLQLSFIGWWLLGILTLGLGFLWIIPYMLQTNTQFYLNLKEFS